MSDEHAQLYETRRKYFYEMIKNQVKSDGMQKSQFFIFQALSELRQIVSCPEDRTDGVISSSKRETLKEQLADAVANNHKVIVFTQYIQALENISSDIESMGINYVTMSGSTANREKVVDRFQNDPLCKVFIATLKTGGFGLNLTEADMVFIYDPWWNVAAENQAIDRTHRIGQKNTVFAYRLITRGTIEEKMLALQQKKSRLFSQIIGTDSGAIKALTEEDIDYLLT
jgi:SNF2 family DNA or RNA helicase